MNSRIRYAPCRGLISFRYARPTMASPIGSLRRSASNSRLKFRNTPWAVSGRRYARSFPVGPTSSGNIMWNSKEDAIVPVVVEACEAAIQVDGGPEETAADGQGHDVLVRGHRGPEGEGR